MSPLLEHILESTYTATDLHRRVRLLQECLEATFYDQPKMRVLPLVDRWHREVGGRVERNDKQVFASLDLQILEDLTPMNLSTKIHDVVRESEKIPVMTIYLPVHFGQTELAPMAAWCRTEVAPGMVFDIEVNPQVVGGCAFVYKDTHFDWSLRKYMRAKKGMVTTLLNTYGQ